MQVLRNELYKPWFIGDKDWGFEIIDGEFSGILLQIEALEFSKEVSSMVDLNYHIVYKPDAILDSDLQGDVFNNLVELIISDILREAIEYEKAGNNYTS